MEGKGRSAVFEAAPGMIQLTFTVSYSVHARVLGWEKTDPPSLQSPIFLLYNMQSMDLVSLLKYLSRVKQMYLQWRWYLYLKARALRSCSSLVQAWSVPLASTLKLSRIFLCLFIPWICFKRQALNSEMAVCVFRARLHWQLIQTGLIFSAPIRSKFLSSSRNQVIFS